MMISAGGMVVRTAIETISERTGRLTSGVKLMNVRDGDRLAAIAILEPSPNGGPDEGLAEVAGLDEDESNPTAVPDSAEDLDNEDDEDAGEEPDPDEDES